MREEIVAVNGTELWVAEQGTGPPLVLCTGGPGCCDYLGPVAAMVDNLVRVYRFEPRGCGRSAAAGPYDLATSLADLDALRAHWGHERWVVGGHSGGAFLALAYALEYPERTSAVLYLSGTGFQDDRGWHAAYEAGRAAGRDQAPDFAYPFNQEVNRIGNASHREYIARPMLLRQLADLRLPMLAIHGDEDIRPSWPVEQLAHLLPDARFASIPGAGHCPWFTHAAELRSLLGAFLTGLSPSEIEGGR